MDTIHLLLTNKVLLLIIIAILGLIIGSFLNVVIYRLPIMMLHEWHKQSKAFLESYQDPGPNIVNLAKPRSHCPHCQQAIKVWTNIPILGYCFTKGKCRHCGKRISARYPLVELITALLSIYLVYHFGISWQALMGLILTWTLIPLIFIDYQHQLLPDPITLPLLWLGLLLSLFNIFTNPVNAIIGAISGYLCLWLIAWIYQRIRRAEGLGHGDFKLLAVFGAWFGWQLLPLIVLLSSLLGAIVGITLILAKKHQRSQPLPYGPYLAIAGWIALVWGPVIMQWYWQWLR